MKKIILLLGLLILLMGMVSAGLETYTVDDDALYLNSVASPIRGFDVISGEGNFDYEVSTGTLNFYNPDVVLEINSDSNLKFIVINGYTISNFNKIKLSYDKDGYLIIQSYLSEKVINYELKNYIVSISKSSSDIIEDYTFEVKLKSENGKLTDEFIFVSDKDNLDFVSSVSLDESHLFTNNFNLNNGDTLTLNPGILRSGNNYYSVNGKIQLVEGNVNQNPIKICDKQLYKFGGSGIVLDSKTNFEFLMFTNSLDESKCTVNSCEYFGSLNSNTELIMACDDINSDTVRFKADVAKDVQGLKFDGEKWECSKTGCLGSANVDLYPINENEGFLRLINNKFESYEVGISSEINDDVLNADQFYIGGSPVYLVDPNDDTAMFEKGSLKVVLNGGTLKLLVDGENKKMKFEDGGKYKIDVINEGTTSVINYVDCCSEAVSIIGSKDFEGYPISIGCEVDFNKNKLFGLLPDYKKYSVGDQKLCVKATDVVPIDDAVAADEIVEENNKVKCGDCEFDKGKMYFGYSSNGEPKFYFFSEDSLDLLRDYSLFSSLKGENIKNDYCENIVCSKEDFIKKTKSSVTVKAKTTSLTSSSVCGTTKATKDWSCSCPMASDNYNIGGAKDYLNKLWTSQDCKDDTECTAGLCSGAGYDPYYCCSDSARDRGGSVDISEKETNPFRKAGSVSDYVSEGGLCDSLNTLACLSSDPYMLKNDEVAICNSLYEWEKYNECPVDTVCDPMSCIDTYELDTCCKPVSTISERDTINDLISEGASCEGFDEGAVSCYGDEILSCDLNNLDDLEWIVDLSCAENEYCNPSTCIDNSEECCFEQTCNDNTDCYNSLGIGYECDGRYCKSQEVTSIRTSDLGESCTTDSDCESGYICDLETDTCFEYCEDDDQCSSDAACDIANGQCVVCEDTDEGDNPQDLGIVDGVSLKGFLVEGYEDYCGTGNSVHEIFCDYKNGHTYQESSVIYCEDNEKCSEGACRVLPDDLTSCSSEEDCENGYACDDGVCNYYCEEDSQCSSDAACNTDTNECVVCEDTDGGKNYLEYGEIEGIQTQSKMYKLYSDECDKNGKIKEHFCEYFDGHTYAYYNVVSCSSGYSCSEGACISDIDGDDNDEFDYVTEYFSQNSDYFVSVPQTCDSRGDNFACEDENTILSCLSNSDRSGWGDSGFDVSKTCGQDGYCDPLLCYPGADVTSASMCCTNYEDIKDYMTNSGRYEAPEEVSSFWTNLFKINTQRARELFSY